MGLAALAAGGAVFGARAFAAGLPAQIADTGAVQLSGAIRTRAVSCVEVMTAYLDRIDRLNPKVNAIVALQGRGELIAQAQRCDAQLAAKEPVGVLHGFPHAVKDLMPVKGMRFTQGSPIFRDFVAQADALQVERLRKAGAIIIGKTNTPEFGLGSHTFNPVYGATRNPFDLSKSAGGSSGGAAVALALKMVPLADGSDYGGSLRNPAGWNNVYGFRTSIGRVPGRGGDEWLPSMGVAGPMAGNVADLALLLSVQAGFDPSAPLAMESDGAQYRQRPKRDFKGVRIAWSGDFKGAVPFEPEVLEVCRKALKSFEAIGCTVEEAVPDYPVEKAWQAFVKLRGWQQGGALLDVYNDPAKRAMLKPEAVYEVEQGRALSGFDVSANSVIRSEWGRAVRALFKQYDYWIVPTAQLFPFDREMRWPARVAGREMRTYHEWMQAVCLVTLSGCPSLAAPAGFGASGLPIGVQIIAPVHGELACLQLAAGFEQANRANVARVSPLLARPAASR
ncbi:amidase [Sphingomonas sp. JC676]|nr:amidase [Sphingomonas sp. JC676]